VTVGRALRHRNYRLFFAGQGISLIGTWLTRFAVGHEAFVLTASAFQLGLVSFFSQAPTAVIAPFAGVLVDRWNRHRTLVVTQVLAMLQSVGLAYYAFAGSMTIWHLVALGAVQAGINAFDMPARQSFVRHMVDDRADLPNAIALNSGLVNGARIAGPLIATALVGLAGFGMCFAVDATSYLAVIASLLAMRVVLPAPKRTRARVRDDLGDGVRYVGSMPLVRSLLILLAVTSTFGGAYLALLPAVAEGAYGGGALELGVMMGAAGGGALCAILYLSARRDTLGLEHVVARASFGLGVALAGLELAPNAWLALPCMALAGGSLIAHWTATNTLVQTIVDDDKLGRVMSLMLMAFFAGQPLGALAEGALATVIGPIHTYALAGAGCAIASVVFSRSLRSGSRRSAAR
jgi:MFS family permease